jgi:hypothetical protein
MYGTVEGNELKAIAGLSDGTTSIVHRAADSNYAIPLAVDNQYGAGYVGISDCCKFLYNPFTGIARVDCMDTTATCVDINTNSNTCEQQRLLAQGFDNEGNLDNKIELTNVCYNANCYVCNDTSGNPVRKPVLHIGTACIDELLGIEQGATVECWCCGTDTNEGNILFTCNDGTGTPIYYDTDLNYDACIHTLCSSNFATYKITNIGGNNNICMSDGGQNVCIYQSGTGCPYVAVGSTISVDGQSGSVWVGNSNANVNIAANGNTSINAPSLSMSATCTYMSLPNALTCVNLMARDHASGQVVEVPEVVYNPTTCELCGKFVPTGGVAVCPTTTSAWYNIVINCATADGLKYSTNLAAVDPGTGRIFASGGLTSDGGPVIKVESGNELNIYTIDGRTDTWINYRGGASELKIGNGNAASGGYGNVYANRAIADLQGRIMMDCGLCANVCTFMPYSGTAGVYGMKEGDWSHFLTFSHGNFDAYYGTAIQIPFWDNDRFGWRTRNSGTLGGYHELLDNRGGQRVYGDFYLGCNNYYVQRDGVDQPVALACDVSGAGMNWLNGTYDSWTSLMGNIPSGRATYGVFNFSPAVSIYDTTTGKTFTTDEIVGTFYRPDGSGMFTGLIHLVGNASGVRNLSFWFAGNDGPNSSWTSIAPIPGTLYGSASSSGINVMGTV